ncbi:hypothetical protein GCM10028805_54330 [Spirosoma harenae]
MNKKEASAIDPESLIDTTQTETPELHTLIQNGLTFSIPKKSLLRFFGKPERTFTIKQPFLGTLEKICNVGCEMVYSDEDLDANPLLESKRLTRESAKKCARVIAIAILNGWVNIFLFAPLLSRYLLWRLSPSDLIYLTMMVSQISNFGDFISAVRLLSAAYRTTQPTTHEE